MIKKIKSIKGLAVFKDFDWDKCIIDSEGNVKEFTRNNIIYGRNYSGKTTLSRIARALETGEFSDKYSGYEFSVELEGEITITHNDYQSNRQNIRVFNEDFVAKNLQFNVDTDTGVEPFAVLGEDNAKIEAEIQNLKEELGSDDEGAETNLHKELVDARTKSQEAKNTYNDAKRELDNSLTLKATGTQTDRTSSIKYKSDLYGDQNYTVPKLESDIGEVLNDTYAEIDEAQREQLTKTAKETALAAVSSITLPTLGIADLKVTVKELVEKEVGQADKIESLVRDAALNRWVQEGMHQHEMDHSKCAFCDNPITNERWKVLEQHFDEESKQLESSLNEVKEKLNAEKTIIYDLVLTENNKFYSEFHASLDEVRKTLIGEIKKYADDLDTLIKQVDDRLSSTLVRLTYSELANSSYKITETINDYNDNIVAKANEYTNSLESKRTEAQKSLRLDTVNEFVKTINYPDKKTRIAELATAKTEAENAVTEVDSKIKTKLGEITNKEKELENESKGAQKVNEYLNHFFGHKYLSLEPITDEFAPEAGVRFEIQRNSTKAYHLSEGEKSLIAFCYFIARLEDTNTNGKKPIIWIDDPISSLDQNHIYFIYSLMLSKIIEPEVAKQLFISTHNLDFLRYIKNTKGFNNEGNKKVFFFIVERRDEESVLKLMPEYMRKYVTEFTHIFNQIYVCGSMDSVEEDNYKEFYGFANNARKFLEMYLFYKYPGDRHEDAMTEFFGDDAVTKNLIYKLDNDNSHADETIENTALPYDIAETHKAAQKILEILQKDPRQYESLLKSIGVEEEALATNS